MSSRRFLTDEQILQALEDSDLDFSSDDEDFDKTWVPDPHSTEMAEGSDDSQEDENQDQVPIEAPSMAVDYHNIRRDVWRKRPFNPSLSLCDPNDMNDEEETLKSPIVYFSKYFTDEFIEHVAQYTNRYSLLKTGQCIGMTTGEIKNFFGVHIAMGCIGYPRVRMYWQNKFRLPVVAQTMTRDRFFKLRMALHVVDQNEVSEDAKKANVFWKIQPLIDTIRQT